MLSSRVRYALSALTMLARRPGQPRTSQRIAAVTGAPLPTLSKILQTLNRAGVIRTTRGPRGGVRLARDASQLTVLDVVHVIDSPAYQRFLRSETLGPCLYRRLELLRTIANLVLSRTTIAELAGNEAAEASQPGLPSIEDLLSRVIHLNAGRASSIREMDLPRQNSDRRKTADGPRSPAIRKHRDP